MLLKAILVLIITLPFTPNAFPFNEYIVRRGDNLSKISEKFNVSVNDLKNLNGLKNDKLRVGELILIPESDIIIATSSKIKEDANKQPSDVKVEKVSDSAPKDNDLGIENNKSNLESRQSNSSVINSVSKSDINVNEIDGSTTEGTSQIEPLKYIVNSGDTLDKISTNFGTSIDEIKRVNGLKNDNLKPGTVLVIPYLRTEGVIENVPIEKPCIKYVVKDGESLEDLSIKFETPIKSIKEANGIEDYIIKSGDVLVIPDKRFEAETIIKPDYRKYVVKRGDNLTSISKKFGISVDELRELNGLASNKSVIKDGMKLKVPSYVQSIDPSDFKVSSTLTDSIYYKVKKGDTLINIASIYNITVKELKDLNELKGTRIKIGQTLVIPDYSEIEEYQYLEPANTSPTVETSYYKNRYKNNIHHKFKGRLISVAKTFLGAPYRFGGNSTSTGIDCSGYVKKVFSILDVDLPRTAREIFTVGRYVAKAELEVGDLVFFRTYAHYPSHVGIYLGDDKFIHASSKSRMVTIDDLNLNYYKRRYIGAKRVELAGLFYDEISRTNKGFEAHR